MQTKALPIYLLLASLIVTVICYFPGLSGNFVLDDFENIVNNDELNINQLNSASITQAAFSLSTRLNGRPLSMVSFALNKFFFGETAYSFKVANLCLHLANGLLVFSFTYLLLLALNCRSPSTNTNISPAWFALIISSIWLIHPINLTGVLYVVQRMTSLAAFFGLLSINFYLLLRIRMLKTGKISISLAVLSIAFLIASTLSKENGILVFLFISLIEIILLQFKSKDFIRDKRLITFYCIALIAPLVATIAWFAPAPDRLLSLYDGRHFTLSERLLTELRVVASYIKWICIPNIQELSLYHDDIAISKSLFSPVTTILSFIFLSILLFLAYYLRKVVPLFSFGITFYFTGHLLESTIFPLEFSFEHRNYLPSIGIFIALLSLAIIKIRFNIKIFIGIFILFSILGVSTYVRSLTWSNTITFTNYSAIHKSKSPRAQLSRANLYLKLYQSGTFTDKNKVIEYLDAACKVDSINISPDVTRLISTHTLGLDAKPEWFEEFRDTLENNPISTASVLSLQKLITHLHNYPESYDKTKIDNIFKNAFESKNLSIRPSMLARLLTVYGNYLSSDPNNYQHIYQLSHKAASLNPKNARLIVNLANIALVLGKFNEVERLIKQLDRLTIISYVRKDVRILRENYARISNNS